jgi:hypothetical protein
MKRGTNMKRKHLPTSSDIEILAREMRLAALDGYRILTGPQVAELKDAEQKLYFNAGRWAAGDRDWTARKAHLELQKRLDK